MGTLFEQVLRIAYPEVAKKIEGEDTTRRKDDLQDIFGLNDLTEEQRKPIIDAIKKEFDQIFEPEMKDSELKKLYELKETVDGEGRIVAVERRLSNTFKRRPTVLFIEEMGFLNL